MNIRKHLFMAMICAIGFHVNWAAELQRDTADQIIDIADKAQNWITVIQGNIDTVKEKLPAEILKNDQNWKLIEGEWVKLKDRLNTVNEQAARMYEIPEDVPFTQRTNRLANILSDIKKIMPPEHDLNLFLKRVTDYSKPAIIEPSKAPQPTAAPQAQTVPFVSQQGQIPLTEMPIADFDVPAAVPQNKYMRLPPLSDELANAGLGAGDYYGDPGFGTLDFGKLHEQGNVVDEEFLTNFFMKTVFQYYTAQLLGYNLRKSIDDYYRNLDARNLNYWIPLSKYGKPSDGPRKNISRVKYLIPSIIKATEKFKQNKLLQELGAAYQRHKIVLEKLEDLLETGADIQDLVLKEDRFLTDLQTLIYKFVADAYRKLIPVIQDMSSFEKITEQQEAQLFDFLKDYKPEFLKEYPYYKSIIDNLAKFRQPVPGNFKWAGKMYTID